MTEQEELVQDIRERLGEMPKRALPFNLLAFTTTIGQRYSMTQNDIIRLVMQEADALVSPPPGTSRCPRRALAPIGRHMTARKTRTHWRPS